MLKRMFLCVIVLLLYSCAVNRSHKIQYPAADDLYVTSGDDPGSESKKPYIPKGKIIQFNQESYFPIPILGIFLKAGNAEPQYVFDNYVTPQAKKMGADALTDAYVGYTPPGPWFTGLIGMRKGQSTLIMGQAVKKSSMSQSLDTGSSVSNSNIFDQNVSDNEFLIQEQKRQSFDDDSMLGSFYNSNNSVRSSSNQLPFSFDAALEVAFPMGDFGDISGMGFGASFKGYYPLDLGIDGKLDATFKAGYIYFMTHEDFEEWGDLNHTEFSLMVGGRYKIPNAQGVYGSIELGMTNMGVSIETDWWSDTDSEFGVSYSIGFGLAQDKLDALLYFNSIMLNDMMDDPLNQIGFRIGYVIQ